MDSKMTKGVDGKVPKVVECPYCQESVANSGKNPHTCKICQGGFNIITRSVPIRLNTLDPEKAEMFLNQFYQMGKYFIKTFGERFKYMQKIKGWHIIDKQEEKYKNAKCECNKKACILIEKKPHCFSCGVSYICGKIARVEVYQPAKEKFSIPRKTFVSLAYDKAKDMFIIYLKRNWGILIRRAEIYQILQKCKKKGKRSGKKDPEEIQRIREAWRNILASISPFQFFHIYQNDRKIQQKNRKKRKERLKKIGKITDLALMIAKPMCNKCEHRENYKWGPECKLAFKLRTNLRMSKLPDFYKSKAKLFKSSYNLDINTAKAEVAIWNKGVKEKSNIANTEWLERYNNDFSDNTKYPELYRPLNKKKIGEKEYYLMYPSAEIVPINSGEWKHIVAYGPTNTCVLSKLNGNQKVKFFGHGEILSFKQYFSAQLDKARKKGKAIKLARKKLLKNGEKVKEKKFTFFNKPRNKGSRKIKNILHNESAKISQYLSEMPGQVVLLNMKKQQLKRGTSEKKDHNKSLTNWSDSIFRPLAKYKLELIGFKVGEKKFDCAKIANCPYCESEIIGNWQDLVLIEKNKNFVCNNCQKECNAMLAIALNFYADYSAK